MDKKPLPEVERFPTHFYADGITGIEGVSYEPYGYCGETLYGGY